MDLLISNTARLDRPGLEIVMPPEDSTLGYLIDQLGQCEAELERAKKLRPTTTASRHIEVIQSSIKQMEFSENLRIQAVQRYKALERLPGFDRLLIHCEAEWGEGVTQQNARRIRGAVCRAGHMLDDSKGIGSLGYSKPTGITLAIP